MIAMSRELVMMVLELIQVPGKFHHRGTGIYDYGFVFLDEGGRIPAEHLLLAGVQCLLAADGNVLLLATRAQDYRTAFHPYQQLPLFQHRQILADRNIGNSERFDKRSDHDLAGIVQHIEYHTPPLFRAVFSFHVLKNWRF